MDLSFTGRGVRWTGTAERAEKGEDDKHQPWRVAVRAEGATDKVEGHLLVTELAQSSADQSGDADRALSQAFGRALTAELAMRRLGPDFRFVLDHRWVVGYDGD